MASTKPLKQINFLRGWPHPSLLPSEALKRAAISAMDKREVAVPALLYGPDPGYQPLREQIAAWLGKFYSPTFGMIPGLAAPASAAAAAATTITTAAEAKGPISPDRIVITGGASQNLACICQVFTDPGKTLRTWMVAPSYFLAGKVFQDNGLVCAAAPEGADGVDLEELERRIVQVEKVEREKRSKEGLQVSCHWSSLL